LSEEDIVNGFVHSAPRPAVALPRRLRAGAHRFVRAARLALVEIACAIREARRLTAARQSAYDLMAMDPHLLRDIGLERHAIEAAVSSGQPLERLRENRP
jgi:uncharacterized protein YjiS (DUF1127 family)